jgi:phosphate transport system protein
MRTRFQQGLDDLRQRLLRMGGLAEQAVDRARQAYVERDLTRCQMVLEGESLINTAEREIDEAAFDLLAMQQPMAVDLRFILAVTKINSDLNASAIRPSISPSASWTWWISLRQTCPLTSPAWAPP